MREASRKANLWRRALGPVLSALALGAVAMWVDLRALWSQLQALDLRWLLAGLGVTALQVVLSALRWRFVAARLGAPLRLGEATAEYYRSLWWNQVLPLGVGGDALRVARHARRTSARKALTAAVLDRVSGQLVLWPVSLAALGAMSDWGELSVPLWVGPAAALALWAARRLRALRGPLEDAREALLAQGAWRVQLGLSVSLLLSQLALFACAARGVGVTLNGAAPWLAALIMLGATSLPVAFAGWGVRELSVAGVFQACGLPPEQGTAVALAFGLLALAGATPGLLLSLLGDAPARAPASEATARASGAHARVCLVAIAAATWIGRPWLAVVVGASSLGVLAALLRRHAPRGFGLANVVTALRLGAVAWLAAVSRSLPAHYLALTGALIFALDALDGWLARRLGTACAFGAWFDAETDALFVLALGACLARPVGDWALIAGCWRYAYLVALQLIPSRGEVPRSRHGRQAFAVLVVCDLCALLPLGALRAALVAVGTLTVSASFLHSLYWSYRPQPARG